MTLPVNEILVGDAMDQLRRLPAQSVQCIVTSPPYFRLRDYGVPGQMGLEKTGEEYLEKMVAVFRQVRRVLRKDGTLWLNMGDAYVGGGRGKDVGSTLEGTRHNQAESRKVAPRIGIFGLKEKQLIGMPWRLALALQADGWWLRQDNIWAKKNCVPEAVRDRTTHSHEYLFHFSRSAHYYYDLIAIQEPQCESERSRWLKRQVTGLEKNYQLKRDLGHGQVQPGKSGSVRSVAGRHQLAVKGTKNKRSVWWIATQPVKEAHYACYPEKLVEPCILAGTSQHGACAFCGTPWRRKVAPTADYAAILEGNLGRNHKKTREEDLKSGREGNGIAKHGNLGRSYQTLGWGPGCGCEFGGIVPCTVLDPFAGAATTGLVALKLGRRFIGIELKPEYAEMARRRLSPWMPGSEAKAEVP